MKVVKSKQFLGGAIVGALIAALVHLALFRPPPRPLGPPEPRVVRQMLLDHFKRELRLTPQQTEKIAPLLETLHKKVVTLKLSQSAEIDSLLTETDQEMIPLLTEEQRARLAEERARMKKMREVEEAFIGPPPPPPSHWLGDHPAPPWEKEGRR